MLSSLVQKLQVVCVLQTTFAFCDCSEVLSTILLLFVEILRNFASLVLVMPISTSVVALGYNCFIKSSTLDLWFVDLAVPRTELPLLHTSCFILVAQSPRIQYTNFF